MNYKKLAVLSALILTLVIGVMMFGRNKTRAAIGGPIPICNVPTDYLTIQDAVNDTGCTTINVAPGTYPEGVAIGRPLTVNGPNAGISALSPRGPEATVTSAGTTFSVTDGTNVTIDGFTINGDFGVYVSGSVTGTVIQNNIVTGTSRALSLDAPGDGASALNNDLVSNTRSLHVSGGAKTNLKVNGNRFSGTASTGIFFSGATVNTIDGFEFKDNQVLHLANIAANISNGTVSGNTFNAAAVGTLDIQIDLHSSTVSGNTFEGNGVNRCLQLFGSQFGEVPSDHVTISGNTFNQCNAYAIQLSPDIHHITITNNDFSNGFDGVNTRAILNDDTGAFVGLWDVTGKEIHINFNNITGNSNFGVNNSQLGILDATCNWWGAANGPGPVGPGSGDKVSTNVDYTPWQTSSGGACVGPDADNDGITDSEDNCPNIANPGQADTDNDGFGDACDVCPNTPGVSCPVATNKDQCKKDGWKTLFRANGTPFKNQGDCVSYTQNGK